MVGIHLFDDRLKALETLLIALSELRLSGMQSPQRSSSKLQEDSSCRLKHDKAAKASFHNLFYPVL